MSRTGLREQIFKILYSIETKKDEICLENIEEVIELYIESNDIVNEDNIKEIKKIVMDIYNNTELITSKIQQYLKDGWKLERISKINIAILKLSIYELKYTQTPYKIVINEAIKIAKRYGDDSSHKYVNGILANIVKELDKENVTEQVKEETKEEVTLKENNDSNE